MRWKGWRSWGPVAGAAALALCAAAPAGADRGGEAGVHLAYGLQPGQVWRSTQTIVRETRAGDDVRSDRGEAVFEYRVGPAPQADRLTLDARFVSLRTAEGAKPFDPGAVSLRAVITRRGRLVASTPEVGDLPPPALPGEAPDPVAYRQMLRSLAEAWAGAVFWLPELPERALAPGDSFVQDADRDLGGREPGIAASQALERTWTLRDVEARRARFDVASSSHMETSTARSSIESERETTGEAVFDLDLGMWVRRVTRSRDRATFEGADGLPGGTGSATATITTTITMERVDPGD